MVSRQNFHQNVPEPLRPPPPALSLTRMHTHAWAHTHTHTFADIFGAFSSLATPGAAEGQEEGWRDDGRWQREPQDRRRGGARDEEAERLGRMGGRDDWMKETDVVRDSARQDLGRSGGRGYERREGGGGARPERDNEVRSTPGDTRGSWSGMRGRRGGGGGGDGGGGGGEGGGGGRGGCGLEGRRGTRTRRKGSREGKQREGRVGGRGGGSQ